MTSLHQVIKEYRVTEKSNKLSSELNQYTFEVNPQANKIEIKQAIQELLSVSVKKVNILRQKGKRKRSRKAANKMGVTPLIKKAIVTLKEGHKLELA
jgi:large subunit ribosomal protein L23